MPNAVVKHHMEYILMARKPVSFRGSTCGAPIPAGKTIVAIARRKPNTISMTRGTLSDTVVLSLFEGTVDTISLPLVEPDCDDAFPQD
jgi:hypothetical protein